MQIQTVKMQFYSEIDASSLQGGTVVLRLSSFINSILKLRLSAVFQYLSFPMIMRERQENPADGNNII